MNITILGPGAMGMLFGGYLSQKHDVTLIGRNAEKMKRIEENGVIIREKNGIENVCFPKALASSEGMPFSDLVILFVKSGNSENALENSRNIIGKDTLLMTLQNGAGHEELLKQYADEENILIGTTQQGSTLIDEHLVYHSGGGDTAFGTIKGNADKYEYISEVFRECGFPCSISSNIGYMIWNKLMINASSSVLSGILQTNQGYVAENKAVWEIAKRLIEEMCSVAKAEGYEFNAEEQTARIQRHLRNAPDGYTSIYADIKNGRITEVRRINGAVVSAAQKHGIAVPAHEIITNIVIGLEQRNS